MTAPDAKPDPKQPDLPTIDVHEHGGKREGASMDRRLFMQQVVFDVPSSALGADELAGQAAQLLAQRRVSASFTPTRCRRADWASSHGTKAHLPPRTSRRRFAEICRSGRVQGAYRDGRIWVCIREAWHSARAWPTSRRFWRRFWRFGVYPLTPQPNFPGLEWSNGGSNPGPPHCERGALPAELLPQVHLLAGRRGERPATAAEDTPRTPEVKQWDPTDTPSPANGRGAPSRPSPRTAAT
jgi:hypothetical protein